MSKRTGIERDLARPAGGADNTLAKIAFERLQALLPSGGSGSVAVACPSGSLLASAWLPAAGNEPLYLAYSVTKSLLATLVLQLCEVGELELEADLARWLPSVPGADAITLRHLLSHTSGIPDYGGLSQYHGSVRSRPSLPWSTDRFLAETAYRGLLFDPGRGWAYSNPGYMLLRLVLERKVGSELGSLVRERLCGPTGLTDTFVPTAVAHLEPLAPAPSLAVTPTAPGEGDRAGAEVDARSCYHPGWVSHGVVASTAADLARLVSAVFGGRLLGDASLEYMTALVDVPGNHARSPWVRPCYGLGLMADPGSRWGPIYGHNGGGPGYGASVFHAPELDGVTVAVLVAAGDGFPAESIVFDVFDELADIG